MSDYAEMLDQLDRGTLDPALFDHRAHVGVTVAALMQGDFYDALTRIARGLQVLTAAAGAPEKFNATLTFGFVSRIAETMQPGCRDPESFLQAHFDEVSGDPLGEHYSPARRNSEIARLLPVLP